MRTFSPGGGVSRESPFGGERESEESWRRISTQPAEGERKEKYGGNFLPEVTSVRLILETINFN